MKKIIILILLSSCSLNNTGNYWNNNVNDKIFDFDKDYSFDEYKKILKIYNFKKKYPSLNQ